MSTLPFAIRPFRALAAMSWLLVAALLYSSAASAAPLLMRGAGYDLLLDAGRSEFRLPQQSVSMTLVGGRDGRLLPQQEGGALQRVYREGVYPGVDQVFYVHDDGYLEYDFIVAPGADPGPIALRFPGAHALALGADGDLQLRLDHGVLRHRAPVAYQQDDHGRRVAVAARFVLGADDTVRVALGDYDRDRELVIDPAVTYSSYLGGSGDDEGNAIAVDSAGNSYVVGRTVSTDFPVVNALDASGGGSGDAEAFVTKYDATGARVFSTYLGGSSIYFNTERGMGVAVGPDGRIYLAGALHGVPPGWGPVSELVAPSSANKTCIEGNTDVFVAVLQADGAAVDYFTCLGGSSGDEATALAVGADGSVYVAGKTHSKGFPVSAGAFQGTRPSGADTTFSDGFVAHLVPDQGGGFYLAYSTFLGGLQNDQVWGIAVDAGGNVYVTGETGSGDFPVTQDAYQGTLQGVSDAFVASLDPGGALRYASYFGGADDVRQDAQGQLFDAGDLGHAIALGADGSYYLAGETSATDLPLLHPYQASLFGHEDAFVAKFSATHQLVYSTYLGGSGADAAYALAVNASGNAIVTGRASAGLAAANTYGGGASDGFLAKLNASGDLPMLIMYLGGSDDENRIDPVLGVGRALALDAAGRIYLSGNTASADFPVYPGAAAAAPADQTDHAGGRDAYMVRVEALADLEVVVSDPPPAGANANLTYTITVTNRGPDDASGVVIEDVLPAGVAFVSASAGCTEVAAVVGCTVGELRAGLSEVRQITVQVNAQDFIENIVTVSGNEFDAPRVNNSYTTQTPVTAGGTSSDGFSGGSSDAPVLIVNETGSGAPVNDGPVLAARGGGGMGAALLLWLLLFRVWRLARPGLSAARGGIH